MEIKWYDWVFFVAIVILLSSLVFGAIYLVKCSANGYDTAMFVFESGEAKIYCVSYKKTLIPIEEIPNNGD